MPARLPDFLGIGTQKGGTTSLHRWLSEHNEIFLPPCKEIHYFDLNHEKPLEWYKDKFKYAEFNQKCGEITPFYLYHPKTPYRIKRAIPKVKLIVLLRDPVERTISQIYHSKQRGFDKLPPKVALEAESERLRNGGIESLQKHSYKGRSLYIEQLDRYERLFEKEQLLILKSENLFVDEKDTWLEVQDFLQVKRQKMQSGLPRANKGIEADEQEKEELRASLRKDMLATAVEIKRRYGFGWEWAEESKHSSKG